MRSDHEKFDIELDQAVNHPGIGVSGSKFPENLVVNFIQRFSTRCLEVWSVVIFNQ